jgi:hypothetical protein
VGWQEAVVSNQQEDQRGEKEFQTKIPEKMHATKCTAYYIWA